MKTTTLTVAALALTTAVSACGGKTETTTANNATIVTTTTTSLPANVADADMGNMAMPAEAKMGKGTGTVTAIDNAAGKITLSHGPIPEVGWPAMTMTFSAKPAILTGVTVGDKVAFDTTVKGNAGEVTAITKQ